VELYLPTHYTPSQHGASLQRELIVTLLHNISHFFLKKMLPLFTPKTLTKRGTLTHPEYLLLSTE
jgi:hypothetical protein